MLLTYVPFFLSVLLQNSFLIHSKSYQLLIVYCVGLFCFKFVKLKIYGAYVFLSQKRVLLSPTLTYLKDKQSKLDSNPYYGYCT